MTYDIDVLETRAVNAIKKHLQSYLEFRKQGKRTSAFDPPDSAQFSEWNIYINSFRPLFNWFYFAPVSWKKYCACYFHTKSGDIKQYPEIKEPVRAALHDENAYIYEYTNSQAKSEIHIFSEPSQISKFVTAHKMQPDFTWMSVDSSRPASVRSKHTRFRELTLDPRLDFLDEQTCVADILLDCFNEKHLAFMLDYRDANIKALLPYLLTAYVFNSPSNKFIRQGSLCDIIFGPESSLGSEVSTRMRTQLDRLGGRFAISKPCPDWTECFADASKRNKPSLWLVVNAPKPWKSQIWMWKIFVAWSGLLLTSESDFIQTDICSGVDFQASYQLFCNRIGAKPLSESQIQNIQECLIMEYQLTYDDLNR